MAKIRGWDTSPEMCLRRELWRRGLRYRLRGNVPVGRPDLAFPGSRVAVFLDGCFWHGCPIHYVRPRTRTEFWAGKLMGNFERDRRHTIELHAAGWVVARIWEHEVEEDPLAVCELIAGVAAGGPAPARWRRVLMVETLGGDDLERRTVRDILDPEVSDVTVGPRNSRSGPSAGRRQR